MKGRVPDSGRGQYRKVRKEDIIGVGREMAVMSFVYALCAVLCTGGRCRFRALGGLKLCSDDTKFEKALKPRCKTIRSGSYFKDL